MQLWLQGSFSAPWDRCQAFDMLQESQKDPERIKLPATGPADQFHQATEAVAQVLARCSPNGMFICEDDSRDEESGGDGKREIIVAGIGSDADACLHRCVSSLNRHRDRHIQKIPLYLKCSFTTLVPKGFHYNKIFLDCCGNIEVVGNFPRKTLCHRMLPQEDCGFESANMRALARGSKISKSIIFEGRNTNHTTLLDRQLWQKLKCWLPNK